ncbi:MAG TPA: YbaN family protein [Microvirga sp.]|jgi:hypothetical protein|nr:YbaN family protein [Microvirga sp.]
MDTPPKRPAGALSALWRPALFVAGWLFLGLGLVGLFVPLMPGAVFLILAAACFTRSSPRFEAWLLAHPRFGPPVRQWRETGSIPRYAKVFAVGSLAASWTIILFTDAPDLVKAGCAVLFFGVAAYVVSRPEIPPPTRP